MTTKIHRDPDHLQDWKDQRVQQTTDAIVESPNHEIADRSSETAHMAYSQHELATALREIMLALNQANDKPVQRVCEQGSELETRSVYCKAGITTRLCFTNFNRSRVILSGIGANVIVSTDKGIALTGDLVGVYQLNGDGILLPYTGVATPWTRDFRTLRALYAISITDSVISVQDEFLSGIPGQPKP